MKYKSQVPNYLECKWRLVWLRDPDIGKPNWGVNTELVRLDNIVVHKGDNAKPVPFAMFKATITDEVGTVIGSGHGTENATAFADYIEKAETSAIARALAAAGFGTQFAVEFDETDDSGNLNLADSPVESVIKATRIEVNGNATAPQKSADTPSTPAPVAPPSAAKCNECGGAIEGYTSKSGKNYSAGDVIQGSTKDLGSPHCRECYAKKSTAQLISAKK
jgi:hypothetical protein